MARAIRALLTLVFVLSACGGADGGPSDAGSIAVEAGSGPSAVVGSLLAPYRVKVTDVNGAPTAGASVSWTVRTGGGNVQPPASVTDAGGIAEAVATLGLASGVQTVRASAGGYDGSPVVFTSTGLPDAPVTLQRVSGNNQTGPVSGSLPLPLVLRVLVALDVSGTLSGNLAGREIARIKPGGPGNTFVWGVMLYGNSLYASEMLSGLWQLRVP